MGTGNDLARALGISPDIDAASHIIAEGKIDGVNLGQGNGDYFANAASVGFSARIGRRTTGWMKLWLGIGAYLLAAVVEFSSLSRFDVRLIGDGWQHEMQTSTVIVWNGRFHAGWELPPPPDKGLKQQSLLIYAPAVSNRLGLLKMALSPRLGGLVKAPPHLALETTRIIVEADPLQDVDVDGEILHRTPVTIHLAPRAPKVVVPKEFVG